jgi:hypothetical protein
MARGDVDESLSIEATQPPFGGVAIAGKADDSDPRRVSIVARDVGDDEKLTISAESHRMPRTRDVRADTVDSIAATHVWARLAMR